MRRAAALVAVLLLAAWALAAAAGGGQAAERRAPAYHHPWSWWRARHSDLVRTGPLRGERPDGRFQAAECLICHRAEGFCNRCHARLGAPRVPEQRP